MLPAEQRVLRLSQMLYADLLGDCENREREGERLAKEAAASPVTPSVDCAVPDAGGGGAVSSARELRMLPSLVPYVGSYRFPTCMHA